MLPPKGVGNYGHSCKNTNSFQYHMCKILCIVQICFLFNLIDKNMLQSVARSYISYIDIVRKRHSSFLLFYDYSNKKDQKVEKISDPK
ncbi:unnamed protein product [Acanthoscelides obtectus]|uniref:Uncharacterized protein n=1 Tax=Acanthoscelides obtectus TaxID=200917 RepID=A0A9P0KGE4_ACAOB|nr:unnamed protein product [Acanthoscelides obtectus]CAK1640005.1 hypothetical protein AOBTE_LOCUS11499 [Acanthoscelides obtectus]